MRRDARDLRHLRLLIASTVGPTDLCVDVGANVGSVARVFLDVAPTVQHLLVEPVPELAARLKVDFPACEVYAGALSDVQGTAQFAVNVDRPTRSSLDPDRADAQSVTTMSIEVTTLDALLRGQSPRLVKIDVEGAELRVLRGSACTLTKARPLVVFEHGPLPPGDHSPSFEIHGLFEEAGYRLFDIDGAGPLSAQQFVDAASSGRIWNFVAVPPSGTDAAELARTAL
jgi:FkbM family methyltransferase